MTSDVSLGVTASDAALQAQQTQAQAASLNSDFDDFLILLTTQLQNQDPLNPTDSSEFTNQLVQFSQVEQQINTNDKLDALIAQQIGTAVGQAVGFVGKDITYQSIELPFDGTDPVKMSYYLPEGVVEAKINIRDEEGEVIYSSDISTASGLNDFQWDGTNDGGETLAEGTYTFTIDALDYEGNAVNGVSSVVTGNVSGIEIQNGLIFLLVGERAVELSNVINVKEHKANTVTDTTDTTDETDSTDTTDETDETDAADGTDTTDTTDTSGDGSGTNA